MFAKRLIFASLIAAAAMATSAASAAAQSSPPADAAASAREAKQSKPKSRTGRGDISIEEIEASNASDAYSVVRQLRPSWLRSRGRGSINRPEVIKVYQDGMEIGGPGALRQISAGSIARISYLDGMTATQRFGTDHGSGAILIETRSR